MSKDLHRQAETFMADAEILCAEGQIAEAAQSYYAAAQLELAAFDRVPEERPRTRGIVGISSVSLYRRASMLGSNPSWFSEARRAAYSILSYEQLPDFAQEQITILLDSLRREEAARKQDRVIGDHGFGVFLHGAEVYPGAMPVDTFMYKLKQFTNYFTRVGEMLAAKPFRPSGPPPEDVTRVCLPLITQPSIGSFQFDLRFDSPYQMSLFDDITALNSKTLVATSFDLIDVCAKGSFEDFSQRVVDEQYRQILLRLVKNIAPSSGNIAKIELVRLGSTGGEVAELTRDVHHAIRHELFRNATPSAGEDTQSGKLRALDLDRGSVRLDGLDGSTSCKMDALDSFEDLIGPFVNRNVRVTGRWRTSGRSRVFIVREIDEADDTNVKGVT